MNQSEGESASASADHADFVEHSVENLNLQVDASTLLDSVLAGGIESDRGRQLSDFLSEILYCSINRNLAWSKIDAGT